MKIVRKRIRGIYFGWRGYFLAIGLVALATWLKYLAQPQIIPANIPILYIVAIVLTATFFGLGPSILACILSVWAYDFFFVQPVYTLTTLRIQDYPIMAIFFLVGVLISYLSANLRKKTNEAIREVSARRQSEAELAKYRDHLEDLVKQRTNELEKANLDLQEDIIKRNKAEDHLKRDAEHRQLLLGLSMQVVAEKSLEGILTKVADAVRTMTDAQIAISGHGYEDGKFMIGGVSRAEGYAACPPGKEFRVQRGGVYLELIQSQESILLTSEQLEKYPALRGLPQGHAPLRGLLGARLFDVEGKASGIIMVSDKAVGEFTEEDEALVKQIATITSLALQHIEARNSVEARAAELEVSNKELESFSYSVSHDLRSPLRSMDGFSQALLEDYEEKLDMQGKEWLHQIRDSSQLMARLIDDILGLSKVVRAGLQIEKVNLSDIAASIAERLKTTQPDRHVDFNIISGIEARGDVNLLRLVLENLLGNAFKFTAKCQSARIEFNAGQREGQIVYLVRDNGAGFDKKYADKLFKPFQRLHSTEEFEGTGIGLATVQRVIQRHGGKVWADGEAGKGAIFYFTLNQGGQ